MPRTALCCKVRIKIKTVTCPGTLHLVDRNLVFITVSILAQTKRTKSVFASFPFIFQQKLNFERIFTNASNLDQLLEILEDEIVSVELRQYSADDYDGQILAKFEAPSRQFLFPAPSFAPKDDINREILLTRTSNYSPERSIDPKLEFSTKTKIEEAAIASSSMTHLARKYNHSSSIKAPSPKRSPMPAALSSSSETEEEVVITVPKKEAICSMKFQHCVCECSKRPENNGRFFVRSRSVSPGKSSPKENSFHKPPFRAGKAPENLISKRDFGHSPLKNDNSSYNEKDDFTCSNCLVPHPDCSLCAAYKRTYGNSFLRHRFSNDLKRTPPSPSLHKKTRKRSGVPKRARARIPITPPTVLSEDDDRCPAPLNASPETQKYRTKMFNKVGRESKSPSKDVNSSYVRGAVKDLLRKNDSVLQYELTDSESEDSLNSDVSDAGEISYQGNVARDHDHLKGLPDRSIVVPLNGKKCWSRNAQKFSGRSHREVFNDSLSEIYKSLYKEASTSD